MLDFWNILITRIQEVFDTLEGYLLHPEKRTYYLYLISSLILAFWVFIRTPKFKGNFLQFLFPKNTWLSKSAYTDYGIIVINALVKVFFIIPFLVGALNIAVQVDEYLFVFFGKPNFYFTQTQTLWLYTIALTVFQDLGTYIIHYAMHKIPFLWEFHKVHHSAEKLLPLTQYRIHPVELIINNLKYVIVFGLVTGFFDYFSYFPTYKYMVYGVNIFSFIFLAFGANLRHSYVKLKYPDFIERIFISPFQHQIHHSNNPAHFDKNMGSKFAIWDAIFGTLVRSKNIQKLRFGIGEENKEYQTTTANLWLPFKKSALIIASWFKSKKSI